MEKIVFVLGKTIVCLGLLQPPPHAFIIVHATYWRSIKYVHIRAAKSKEFGLPILPRLVFVQDTFCHPAHVWNLFVWSKSSVEHGTFTNWIRKWNYVLTIWKLQNFLSLRFYVKSNLVKIETQNMPFYTFRGFELGHLQIEARTIYRCNGPPND